MESPLADATATLWAELRHHADATATREPALAHHLDHTIRAHSTLEHALARHLAAKLTRRGENSARLGDTFLEAITADTTIVRKILHDLHAIVTRDPACDTPLTPFLWFKGFHAITTHRLAHWLWESGREHYALHLQSLASETFAVDIHPAARLGQGILLDHATGFVVGETAVIDDDVSILHAVTLGGTGKDKGDRHPKVRRGVLIGAGAKILGNIEIGEGAKIGAGSVVLQPVAPHTTVAGVPAILVGPAPGDAPAFDMDHNIWTPVI
ncbi:MAG: serine O-acetyltransferase [Puniceicoccales bacterium]|jgi:serine O-acetyltransferase|nr:serine O-acetyltransferase [Puniceicoccales bacterium]